MSPMDDAVTLIKGIGLLETRDSTLYAATMITLQEYYHLTQTIDPDTLFGSVMAENVTRNLESNFNIFDSAHVESLIAEARVWGLDKLRVLILRPTLNKFHLYVFPTRHSTFDQEKFDIEHARHV